MPIGDRSVLVRERMVFEYELLQLLDVHLVGYVCIARLSDRFYHHLDSRVAVIGVDAVDHMASLLLAVPSSADQSLIGQWVAASLDHITRL